MRPAAVAVAIRAAYGRCVTITNNPILDSLHGSGARAAAGVLAIHRQRT
jgi:hypothetical protein